MKKFTLLFVLIFAMAKIQAQDYQISFAASGASTTIDSVKAENLTRCTHTTVIGSDVLHFLFSLVDINKTDNLTSLPMHVYPNPTPGHCLVDFEATRQGPATITLADMSGKQVLRKTVYASIGHHSYTLEGTGNGIYMLTIESDQYAYTSKLVSNGSATGESGIRLLETTPFAADKNTSPGSLKKTGFKSEPASIDMQYNTGDLLKLTGYAGGTYRTLMMLIPNQSQAVSFIFQACTDADSNRYTVVQIDTKLWMAENLNTTKYRDGSDVPNLSDSAAWHNSSNGAYCDYGNSSGNSLVYGKLYNWYAVNDPRNIAPVGWHVASDEEWSALTNFLGGENIAGGKLKEACSAYWETPNTGATNETGFTALPGGHRLDNSTFHFLGLDAYFWTSTQNWSGVAWYRNLYSNLSNASRVSYNELAGFSVRCVKN